MRRSRGICPSISDARSRSCCRGIGLGFWPWLRRNHSRERMRMVALLLMSVIDLEQAIERLSPEDLAKFREWFTAFDAERWDRQIERDVEQGRLDALADEALRDFHAGRSKKL